jgi:transcriptional regulator with XRE-family HTH domain
VNFTDLRKRAGYTQMVLADISGVSEDAISNIERGMVRSSRYDTVKKLAVALDVSPSEVGAAVAAQYAEKHRTAA